MENHRRLQLFALIIPSKAMSEKSHIYPFLAQLCTVLTGSAYCIHWHTQRHRGQQWVNP